MAARLDVPYYAQSSEFSCGPACVLMTRAFLDNDPFALCRTEEFTAWRRTCMIGLGGSDAFGLALPFVDRGYQVKVYNEHVPTIPKDLLLTFLTEEDARLTELSSRMARGELQQAGVEIVQAPPDLATIEQALTDDWVPNCLVGMQEVHEEEVPHWVVVFAIDEETVTFHDPYPPHGRQGLTVARPRFQKMLDDIGELGCSRGMVLARQDP